MYQSTNSPIRSGGGFASRRCCVILLVDWETGKLVDWDMANITEQRSLDQLHAEANRLMLRKSYVYVLLKWRGHQAPRLTGS